MNKNVNTLRILSAETVQAANSGHPGLPLGAAPMAYTLWDRVMHHNPSNPKWINRDRFVLSAGHGSALLYSLLHLYGYGLTLDDLKDFRQLGSLTPGHPEYGHTLGVETTTGPLGQGFANAVGMAMAERYMAHKFNKEDLALIDYNTYVLVGDGCLMEGISYEAASFAGKQKLNKLIALYDSNSISIEGSTDLAFTENVKDRFEAMDWQVVEVEDGNDLDCIEEALLKCKKSNQPSLVIIKTIIGYGALDKAGSHDVHGAPLGQETIDAMKVNFNLSPEAFHVEDQVREHFLESQDRLEAQNQAWDDMYVQYQDKYPDQAQALKAYLEGDFRGLDLDALKAKEKEVASRSASGEAINLLAALNDNFLGGSADLGPSNKSVMTAYGYSFADNPGGRNIHFGVREHAMGAIVNGMTVSSGLKVFGATFMVFSDYMKATMRLAALMDLPSIFLFTHDSIGVGEDGPTHQPIEHLWMLRSIPNLTVHRPADYFETMAAWHQAVTRPGPHALVMSRQNLKPLTMSSKEALKGGYIVHKEDKPLKGIILATGSEVQLAIDAAMAMEGIRVVSMPSVEVFEQQDSDYKEAMLPSHVKTLAVEAGAPLGWYKYADEVIGMEGFGASGPGQSLFEHFGFTKENIMTYFK